MGKCTIVKEGGGGGGGEQRLMGLERFGGEKLKKVM